MNQIDNIMAGIKPDTHCWDDDTGKDVWSYSEGLVRAAIAAALVPKPKKYLHEYTSAPHPGDFGIAQEHWQWASDYHEAMKRWEYTAAQPHPKQEPVAWVLEWSYNGDCVGRRLYDDETHCKFDAGQDGGICRPLIYGDTAPQPQQPPIIGLQSVHDAITADPSLAEPPQPKPDDTSLLRQALEALEADTDPAWECNSHHPKVWSAITTLRERLK